MAPTSADPPDPDATGAASLLVPLPLLHTHVADREERGDRPTALLFVTLLLLGDGTWRRSAPRDPPTEAPATNEDDDGSDDDDDDDDEEEEEALENISSDTANG